MDGKEKKRLRQRTYFTAHRLNRNDLNQSASIKGQSIGTFVLLLFKMERVVMGRVSMGCNFWLQTVVYIGSSQACGSSADEATKTCPEPSVGYFLHFGTLKG